MGVFSVFLCSKNNLPFSYDFFMNISDIIDENYFDVYNLIIIIVHFIFY